MLAALSTPDTIVLVVCALAALRGAWTGFAWQLVRAVGILGALWVAVAYHGRLAAWLDEKVSFLPSIATPWIAGISIFVVLLVLVTYLAWMAKGLIHRVRLGGIDRFLGFLLGAGFGLVVVTIGFLVYANSKSNDALRETFADSVTVPWMAKVADGCEPLLPPDVRTRLSKVLHALDVVGEPAPTENG